MCSLLLCCWKRVFAMTSVLSWENSVSLCFLHSVLQGQICHYSMYLLTSVMPKLQNLPMTTREPIADAKAREFLLPSLSWGSHRYRCSSYREEPRVLGYIAYIGYIRVKGDFQARGHLIGHPLSKGVFEISDWFLLPKQTTNS